MNTQRPFNPDLLLWKSRAEEYRKEGDNAPTVRVLEGMVWAIPRGGTVAQFESTEEAEKVLLAAGFKFIPEYKGFRA
jgi:hypothetical protein